MNKRLLWVLAFALAVSGVASFVLYRLISSKIAIAAKPVDATVLVAARDLVMGTLVRSADVRELNWSGPAPSRAILNRKDVEERGVIATIYSGEPILEDRLAPKGAGAGMAATIPAGKRAMAVRVNDVVGLAGFVTPGMRVDVVVIGHTPGSNNLGSLSKTILQNIEVISAGQQIQKDAEGKPVQVQVVNLLVTPDQAEMLSLASNDARIQLVLRNPLDKDEVKTKGTALARLFADQAPERPAWRPKKAAPPPPPTPVQVKVTSDTQKVSVPILVEIIHGSKRAESKFKNEDKPKSDTDPVEKN
ncbi:MAG: Flp pilus assembly protein CpaB [Acidobacteria bacterium]|nr:Flp pilus assembly protein CpaB [Acidobacteriota bacterium]